jgi:hypothetical protein
MGPEELSDRPTWNKYKINGTYYLFAHPDLVQTEVEEKNKKIILLGDMYDPSLKLKSNDLILDLLIKEDDINEIIRSTFQFAGRFAIFCTIGSKLYIFHDASGSRKVFYTIKDGQIWCASRPHVLAEYCDIQITTNEQVLDFYQSENFFRHDKVGVIDNTIYDPIKQLLPNHYLDAQKKEHFRFWPEKRNMYTSLSEGVELGSKMLAGIIESANERQDLMMAVTAGNDTRLLLAASKKVSNNIFYYTTKTPKLHDDHQDIVIPNRLLEKNGLKFHIIDYIHEPVDEEFRKIYLQNNQFANERELSRIYNVYYKRFPEKINLPGRVSDISRNFFNTYKKKITPELLAIIWEYDDIEYVIKNYREWLRKAGEIAKTYNYNILELFNWEERNGNLYTAYQMDKDIAQEEFTPYNCRRLMEIFLSVPSKYRDIHTNVYYRAMIKHLWPELLAEPINPNLKKYTSYYLKKVGVYWLIRRLIRGW